MAERLFQPSHSEFLECFRSSNGCRDVPEVLHPDINHQGFSGTHRLGHLPDEFYVPVLVESQMRVPSLAEAYLGTMKTGCRVFGDLFGHVFNPRFRAVQACDGRQLVPRGAAQQIKNANVQYFALEVPERNVDSRQREGRYARAGSVPPHMLLELAPYCFVLQRALTDNQFGKTLNQLGGRQSCFRKECAALAPSLLPVLAGDLDQADGAKPVVIRRFPVGNRKGFDRAYLRSADHWHALQQFIDALMTLSFIGFGQKNRRDGFPWDAPRRQNFSSASAK